MTLSDFDHVPTSAAREIRDSAKRLAEKHAAELGACELTAVAWATWQAYKLVVEYREALGCR
jgi:hypothetical protein